MSVYHNVNGVIKEVTDIYENVNGVIHKIDARYQNVNGVIRQTYGGKKYLIDTNGKYQNGFKLGLQVANAWSFNENQKISYAGENTYYALTVDCYFKTGSGVDTIVCMFPDNIKFAGKTLHFDILKINSYDDVKFAYFRISANGYAIKSLEIGEYENLEVAIPTTATQLLIKYGITGATSLVTYCSNVCHFSGVYIK